MAEESEDGRRRTCAERAAALVSEALDLIDAHGGPVDAAAHLDMALTRLREEAEAPSLAKRLRSDR